MAYELIEVRTEGEKVGIITLNRPKALNALNSALMDELGAALKAWIADPGVDVIIVTGGTGVTPRDVTPEALAPLVTKPIPGFGELFRYLSFAEIGTSTIQSRAEAALCDQTYVFLLPGSTGGVRLGMDQILIPQLDSRHRPCNFVSLLPRIRTEREDGR